MAEIHHSEITRSARKTVVCIRMAIRLDEGAIYAIATRPPATFAAGT